jgi:hypothetical protein
MIEQKIQIIDEMISKQDEAYKEASEEYYRTLETANTTFCKAIEKHFEEVLSTDDTLSLEAELDWRSLFVSVRTRRPEDERDTPIIHLTFESESEYWLDLSGQFINASLELVNNSGSSEVDFGLYRLIIIGEMAKVLTLKKDGILEELNKILSYWIEPLQKYDKARDTIRDNHGALKSERNQALLDEAKKLLHNEGLKFSLDKKGSFEINRDEVVRHIRHVRIVELSKSGKTATVEVQQELGWNNELTQTTYKKVRVANLECLHWQYRDYVLEPQLEDWELV